MNKKELADLRKEFKLETYMLNINEIYNLYIKKDNKAIIFDELRLFDQLDEEMRELYLKNFKKVLTGTIDTKIFELDFNIGEEENDTQRILFDLIKTKDAEGFTNEASKIIGKIIENCNFETDVVVTMIKAEYLKGNRKRREEAEEAIDDVVQAFNFVLCSVNKIDIPKKALRFDFRHKEFSVNSVHDSIINLASPLEGFMFPILTSGETDVNKVLFNNPKPKEIDIAFIEGVLNCSLKMNAEAEKDTFTTILQTAIGETIKPEVIQDIYERINEKAIVMEELDEVPTVSFNDVKTILESCGVGNTNELERAYDTFVDKNYDFKVQNILPDFNSKSIKITNETANITLTPKELNSIRQVKDKNGRKCLLIELTEDVVIDGFKLETEEEEI